MKLPDWLKITWLIILIGFFSYLMAQRYDAILNGSSTPIDIFIFLIWVALITAPLFRAVNIFGVGFRNEFDNLKNEVRGQILNLRSDIQNTISMRTEISPHINLFAPPTDSEIKNLEEQIKPILKKALEERGLEKSVSKLEIPDDNTYLFEVRYSIENELRRIHKQLQDKICLWKIEFSKEPEYLRSVFQITRSLEESGIITLEFSKVLREVYRVCSPAIHGEEVSRIALDFVKDVAPDLITTLKNIVIV